MKKVNKNHLEEALAIVKPGLANKEMMEQTNAFAFLKNRVVTYNDEISISHPIEGVNFEGAIKAEELYGLLTKLSETEIDLSSDGEVVLIKAGRVKAGLKLETEIFLPLKEEIGKIKKWHKLKNPQQFVKHLTFAMQTCSSDMSQPKLTCVCVRKSGLVQGSDGFRVVQCKGEKSPVDEYLLPAHVVAELIKLNPVKMASNKSWVHFLNANETVMSCRKFDSDYVDQKRVDSILKIDKHNTIEFPEKIGSAVERARGFAKRDFVFDEMITIEIKKGQLAMSAEAKDTKSWIKEKAVIKYKGEVTFSITPMLLHDILKETRMCALSNDGRRAKFISEEKEWEYVIMLRGAE